MGIINKDKEVDLLLTTAEAVEEVKKAIRRKARTKFLVRVRVDLPLKDKENHAFRDGGSSFVRIDSKQAVNLVSNLMSETLEERGARIPVSITEESWELVGKVEKRINFWIG